MLEDTKAKSHLDLQKHYEEIEEKTQQLVSRYHSCIFTFSSKHKNAKQMHRRKKRKGGRGAIPPQLEIQSTFSAKIRQHSGKNAVANVSKY